MVNSCVESSTIAMEALNPSVHSIKPRCSYPQYKYDGNEQYRDGRWHESCCDNTVNGTGKGWNQWKWQFKKEKECAVDGGNSNFDLALHRYTSWLRCLAKPGVPSCGVWLARTVRFGYEIFAGRQLRRGNYSFYASDQYRQCRQRAPTEEAKTPSPPAENLR